MALLAWHSSIILCALYQRATLVQDSGIVLVADPLLVIYRVLQCANCYMQGSEPIFLR